MAEKNKESTMGNDSVSSNSTKAIKSLAGTFVELINGIGEVETKKGIKNTVVITSLAVLGFEVFKRTIWPKLNNDSLDICVIFSAILLIMTVLVINNLEFNETLRSNLREKELAAYLGKLALEQELEKSEDTLT